MASPTPPTTLSSPGASWPAVVWQKQGREQPQEQPTRKQPEAKPPRPQPQSKTTKTTRTTTPKQPRTAPKWVENGFQKAPKVLPGGLRPAGGVLGGPWGAQGRC